MPAVILDSLLEGANEQPTLEDAVALAQAGDTILLESGEYAVKEQLLFDKTVKLQGAGSDKTIVRSTFGGCSIRFERSCNCRIEGIAFMRQSEAPGDVLQIEIESLQTHSKAQIRIRECQFSGGVVSLRSLESDVMPGGNGICVIGNAEGEIENCVFHHNESGVEVTGDARITLRHNHSYENVYCGLLFSDIAKGSAIGNRCHGNDHGIMTADSAKADVQENNCSENGLSGINVTGFAQSTVIGNICSKNGTGILIDSGAVAETEGNTCDRNRMNGIAFLDGGRGSARSNACSQNQIGIYDNSGNDVRIGENSLSNNAKANVLLSGRRARK